VRSVRHIRRGAGSRAGWLGLCGTSR
jgi:hypothetical protein